MTLCSITILDATQMFLNFFCPHQKSTYYRMNWKDMVMIVKNEKD